MQKHLAFIGLASIIVGGSSVTLISPAQAQFQTRSLSVVYPPPQHSTSAEQIFLIGTAPPDGQVLVNGQVIPRSPGGHFAPSFPLQMGENVFNLRYNDQTITFKVTRVSNTPTIPSGVAFAPDSLTPERNIARLPNEPLCFSAVAPPNAQVAVKLSNQTIPLLPEAGVNLPPNSAVLTFQNQPTTPEISPYLGCTRIAQPGNLGTPTFQLSLDGKQVTQTSPAQVTILSPSQLQGIEVTAEEGVARTGPSTNYSRLTPLPKGTRAIVTGREGDWLRLDYGAWIRENETQAIAGTVPPTSIIRSISSREVPGATEVVFPLQTPVPISIEQDDQTLTLTLHNLVAQTDTIFIRESPVIKRLDWRQVTPESVEYTFRLKSEQQWGYDFRYEGTNLILSLAHPPQVTGNLPLSGVEILLDPGHGGNESGSLGPTGIPEKVVNLTVSELLQQELLNRGATVYMTRETDVNVSLRERMDLIDEINPAIALSVHYNALPDSGDAMNTAGIGMFWYHPQAYSLAQFLHNYLVDNLNRPSYGVFWNNLALTRPHSAPSVLMELGFMINPNEFEWITNPEEQKQLAKVLADGIVEWLQQNTSEK